MKAKDEVKILREYQNTEIVKTVKKVLDNQQDREKATGQFQLNNKMESWGIKKLIQFQHKALNEAGCVADENGQYHFGDVIFFDMQMSDQDKIEWLTMMETDSTDQTERIEALKE